MRVISDVHLGHTRTSSWRMLAAIRKILPDSEESRAIDIFTITGDLFDQLINLDNVAAYVSYAVALHIFTVCRKYDIVFRNLLGTKSHDRNQQTQLVHMWEHMFPDVDFKYVTKLSIEHIERFNLDILYLPDEWNPQADKTLKEAKDLIHAYGLKKVHIAFTHGAFTHQLNGFQSPSYHDPIEWSNLVWYHVISGHIHTRSIFLKIISVGSLERLGHDQEEAKGAIHLSYRGIDDYKYRFLENHNARIYRTYNLAGLTINDIIQVITDDNLPNDSAVRLEYTDEPITQYLYNLENIYPTITFTSIKRGKKKAKILTNNFMGTDFNPVSFNENNLTSLVVKRANEERINPEVVERMEKLMKGS